MWELDHEGWALKNWCFWTLVLEKTLESPLDSKINLKESILKEINPENSLEGLMVKLKLQYFGYLLWKSSSLEKTLMLGKTEGRRRRGWQRIRWLDGIIDSMDMNLSKLWEIIDREACLGLQVCCSPWGRKMSDMTERLEQQWTMPNTTVQWRTHHSLNINSI